MKFIVFVLIACFIGCSSNVELPNVGASLKEKNIIYSREYSTYSLFFNVNQNYSNDTASSKTDVLIKSFKSFYTGIGNNNIGIWVGSSIGRFDVEESKKLCDDYDLSYNEGPYLIVSKDNPLSRATIADDVVINFDGVNPERIQYILNEIEQDIRKGEYNKKGKIESYKQFVISQYDNHKEVIKDIAREIADILRSYTKS